MHTVTIRKDGKDQIIELPADIVYKGVKELEISRDGDVITLRPARPSWASLIELPQTDTDLFCRRPVVVEDEGKFAL
ncbi:MAG: AbrB/MazE/SpoVT family DNA-binding domain-containing protein [Castellaniella sp.]